MRHTAQVRPELRGTTANSPTDLAKRFYDDSLTHSLRVLHFLVDMVGCDRIILGRDFPFDMRDHDPIVAIHSLTGPNLQEIEAILGEMRPPFFACNERASRLCGIGKEGAASLYVCSSKRRAG